MDAGAGCAARSRREWPLATGTLCRCLGGRMGETSYRIAVLALPKAAQ